jgi:lipopolysaccharide export system protein LptA
MTASSRRVLLLIAGTGISVAFVVPFAFDRPQLLAPATAVVPIDDAAIVEVVGGRLQRFSDGREDVRVEFDRQLTYAGGRTRLTGVRLVGSERGRSRSVTVTGNEAQLGADESTLTVEGNVRIAAGDGLTARTERMTYRQADGVASAPGAVEFSGNRFIGSAVGMAYEKGAQVLNLLDRVVVTVAGGEQTRRAVVRSATASFNCAAKVVQFAGGMQIERAGEVMRADSGRVHLTGDDRVDLIELRGGARVDISTAASGVPRSLEGQAIELQYAPADEALEKVRVSGGATLHVTGEAHHPGWRLAADAFDVIFARDRASSMRVVARDSVELVLPGDDTHDARIIRAAALEAENGSADALTSIRLSGNVHYRERLAGIERSIRSQSVVAELPPDGSDLQRASFTGQVRFDGSTMTASTPILTYDIASGTVSLTGSDPSGRAPHLGNSSISIDASAIDITLKNQNVRARGNVRSALASGAFGGRTDRPLFLGGATVESLYVVAGSMDYDGVASRVTYSDEVQMWGGGTSLRAQAIVIDASTGNVMASGRTIMSRQPVDAQDQGRLVASAMQFTYEGSLRRAVFTDDAHMSSGPAGELAAARIEVRFNAGDNGTVDRIEAYDNVTVRRFEGMTLTGNRFTYVVPTGSYTLAGAPMTIDEDCGRRTLARTLAFDKPTDTVMLDGARIVDTADGRTCSISASLFHPKNELPH